MINLNVIFIFVEFESFYATILLSDRIIILSDYFILVNIKLVLFSTLWLVIGIFQLFLLKRQVAEDKINDQEDKGYYKIKIIIIFICILLALIPFLIFFDNDWMNIFNNVLLNYPNSFERPPLGRNLTTYFIWTVISYLPLLGVFFYHLYYYEQLDKDLYIHDKKSKKTSIAPIEYVQK